MTILAIDTSCNACTAAIVAGDKLVAQVVVNNKRTHSEKLMPMIEAMFEAAEVSLSDVELIAVANGPGSFTGVRIGVATAQGLAHSLGIPMVGISTLEALAANLVEFNGIVCPMLNARREQVYTGLFRWENGELAQELEDCCLTLGELLNKLVGANFVRPQAEQKIQAGEQGSPLHENVIFLGDGIFEFREQIEAKLGERAKFAPPHLNMNLAGSVAFRALEYVRNGGEISVENIVVPNYLRLSQAERELGEKLNEG